MGTTVSSKPRLGLIARADNTGLGVQTHELYKHLKPHKTYIIDLTELNAQHGKVTANFLERYPDGIVIQGFPTFEQCTQMLQDIDVLLTVEIPYNYDLFSLAKEYNVKTALQYNYEFLDYLASPELPLPDLFLAPSPWHFDDVKEFTQKHFAKLRYLPVPINRDLIPFQYKTRANNFLHVAGHKTHADRNGTLTVMQSLPHIKSDITLSIHTQSADVAAELRAMEIPDNVTLDIVDTEVKEYYDIYNNPHYDVLLLPRRYGGLSLQLHEAMSAGMPVIMSNVSPNNTILPQESLIEPIKTSYIQTRTQIEVHDVDPKALAAKIDELHNDQRLVTQLSLASGYYADKISWDNMLPKYEQILEELCRQ